MTYLWRTIVTHTFLLSSVCGIECPLYCQCYQQSGINSFFCLNTHRHYIPNYFDFDVKLVNISGNVIPRLAEHSFQNQHYRSLEILDLRRNGIARIDNKAFYLLKNLLEIDLSANRLRSVNRKMFTGNRFLNTIILSGNPIKEIKHYAFPFSIYLRRLNFQGCRIRRIHDRAFINSPMVEYLNLKDNDLRSLSLNVLHNSSQLTQLLLDGNPWRCDKDLWSLLRWIRDHEAGKDSLLCVYGETNNAILWDTMEADDPAKFESYPVWKYTRKRSRRSQPSILTIHDYHQEDPSSTEENENEFSSLKYDILSELEARKHASSIKTSVRKRPSLDDLDDKALEGFLNKLERRENQLSNELEQQKNHTIFPFSPSLQLERLRSKEQTTTDNENEILVYMEDDESSETESAKEEININVLLSLIAIEFTLLLVLLYILYKLWKWNKQSCEQGEANTPLNNSSKNTRTYDTNSPGYKRYSLSDDNFSINNNTNKDKYDAESGYLSYHRYNSIESETNNEFSYYKRYPQETSPHSQNLNSTENSSESSVMGPRSHDSTSTGSENKTSAGIRRNSSVRSLGRRMKVNPYDRSISVDTARVADRYNLMN